MKSLLMSLVLIAVSQVVTAAPVAKSGKKVLEIVTSVVFAPPGSTGAYETVVEANGRVVYIDNKNVETEIARLSDSALANLKSQVAKVEAGELQRENDGPECMDAPTTTTSVIKEDGTAIIIKQLMGCQPATLPSQYGLIYMADGLQKLVQGLR
jgi:hypothetical protein